ncbi:MAG: hypothetical protein MRERC_3c020 [Mycoplasmataceae bacterium RC_NB112A]|nr:MAG: hypothetical protein MRERC_3c020 [Mycoplasmataceae bacterium RC_NB112A]
MADININNFLRHKYPLAEVDGIMRHDTNEIVVVRDDVDAGHFVGDDNNPIPGLNWGNFNFVNPDGELILNRVNYPNVTRIILKGRGAAGGKSNLTGFRLVGDWSRLIGLNIENNHLANLNIQAATGLRSLDVSDNAELNNLDLTNNTQLRELDLHGTNLNDFNDIEGLFDLTNLCFFNGGLVYNYMNNGTVPADEDRNRIKLLVGLRKYIAWQEAEEARAAGVEITDDVLKAELRKPVDEGGAGAANHEAGLADFGNTNTLQDTPGHVNRDWKKWLTNPVDDDARTNEKKGIVLKIIARRRAVAQINEYIDEVASGMVTHEQLKARINDATGLPGAIGAGTIEDGLSWREWMDRVADMAILNQRKKQLLEAVAYLKEEKREAITQIEAERVAYDALPGVDLTHTQLVEALNLPLNQGGANAGLVANADADDATKQAANQVIWQNWVRADLTRKELVLKVIKRLRIEKLIADTRGTLTDAQIKGKLSATNANGGYDIVFTDANDNAWLTEWLHNLDGVTVEQLNGKEKTLVEVLTKLERESGITQIEAERVAYDALPGVDLTHTQLVEALNLPLNQGGANAGLVANADADDATKQAANQVIWQNWVRADLTRKELVLKVIKRLRIEKLIADTRGTLTDAQIKGKLSATNANGGYDIVFTDANDNAWLTEWLHNLDGVTVEQLNGKEKTLVEVLTKLEREKPKSALQAEISQAITDGIITRTDFKAELRKTVANGGAEARTAAATTTGPADTTDLADSGNDENDWKAWVNRLADTEAEFTAKKTNVQRILQRLISERRVNAYLNDATTGHRTDANLLDELNKVVGTGGGVKADVTDPDMTNWKLWLAQSADKAQVIEREGLLMKAVSASKNSDYKGVLLARLVADINKFDAADTKNYTQIASGGTYTNAAAFQTAAAAQADPVLYVKMVRELATKFYAEINKVPGRREKTPFDFLDQEAVNNDTWDNILKITDASLRKELHKELIRIGKITGTTPPTLEQWVKASPSLLTTIETWAEITNIIEELKSKPAKEQLDTVRSELGITGDIDANKLRPFKDAMSQLSGVQSQLNSANAKITVAETKLGNLDELDSKLGGKTLNDIPAGKTLKDLIENPDSAALQAQITQLNNQLSTKEAEVVKEIHDTLSLGLEAGSITKSQVLEEIKRLVEKGGGSEEDQAKIIRLESEIAILKSQPNTIVKESILEKIVEKKSEQTYGIAFTIQEISRIQNAANAQEALKITNKIVKDKVQGLKSSQQSAFILNWILGGLTVASLVAVAYLLMKGNSSLPATENKEGKKK